MFHQGRILYTSLVSLIMTLIMSWSCQWSLMSLITGNKVKKNTQAKVLWKRKGQSQQKNFEKFKLW
jgi:ribose/xylose/arabinose/galactoside ABC-type transport system permease subunit